MAAIQRYCNLNPLVCNRTRLNLPFDLLKVDIEVEEMCSKHAKRKPVTITRGGNRVRLRAVMPNGGVTLVSYDTRVTSQVCGRVVYVHSDNTEVMDALHDELAHGMTASTI